MSDQAASTIASIQEQAAALDRGLLQLSQEIAGAGKDEARAAFLGVFRTITRLAEAARPLIAACPVCHGTQGGGELEQVNKLSGVWTRPECATCRELSKMIGAVDEVARKLDRTARR